MAIAHISARNVYAKMLKNGLTRSRNIDALVNKQIIFSCVTDVRTERDSISHKLPFQVNQRRCLFISTNQHGVNVRPLTINSRLAADRLIRDMTEVERERLTQALQHLNQEFELENIQIHEPPSKRQLLLAGFSNAVPFVGFGFLDNAIMIVAGEYIDHSLGCALGISTMAAAAIGNMISDVAGIGLAGYVEGLAARFGVEEPHLNAHQLTMGVTKLTIHSGRAIGIIIGCILGMFPLFFINNDDHNHHEHQEHLDVENKNA